MQYIAIGVVTKDLKPHGGYTVGGTVVYAAVAASKLGRSAGVVTTVDNDFIIPYSEHYNGIRFKVKPSNGTATFRNEYRSSGRVQFLEEKPDASLELRDIPQEWMASVEILHIAPLIQEIHPMEILNAPKHCTLLVTPQGWLRTVDMRGLVNLGSLEDVNAADIVCSHADIIVMSDEDLKHDLQLAENYAGFTNARGGVFVLTRGEHGATVYCRGEARHFPTRIATKVVDTTGAGDIFAAAYAIYYHNTKDAWEAARFANAVASMSVESVGVGSIPATEAVELYLEGILV